MNKKLEREAKKLEKEFDCYFRRQKFEGGSYNLIITTINDFDIVINLEFSPYALDYELYPTYFWSSFNKKRLEGKSLTEIVTKINKVVLEEKIMEKRKFNENYKYYYKELMSNAPIDEYGVNIKVGQSKNFPLNSESLKSITDFYYNEVQGRIEESRNSKRNFNENYKYYYKELMSNAPIDKFGVNIKVGRSKNLALNSESLKALTDFYYNEVQDRIEESRKRKVKEGYLDDNEITLRKGSKVVLRKVAYSGNKDDVYWNLRDEPQGKVIGYKETKNGIELTLDAIADGRPRPMTFNIPENYRFVYIDGERFEESRNTTTRLIRNSLTEKSIYTTKMLNQYLNTALWASTDEEGEPLDDNFSINDFSRSSVKEAEKDIKEFLSIADKKLGDDWDREWDDSTIGHCLWLSRNGHGSGFFDEDRPYADELQDIARKMGEKYVFEIAGDLEIE